MQMLRVVRDSESSNVAQQRRNMVLQIQNSLAKGREDKQGVEATSDKQVAGKVGGGGEGGLVSADKVQNDKQQVNMEKLLGQLNWRFKTQATYHSTIRLAKVSALLLIVQIGVGLSLPYMYGESMTEVFYLNDAVQQEMSEEACEADTTEMIGEVEFGEFTEDSQS